MTTATTQRPRSTVRTPEEERAYYSGMARLCRERGFPALASSYAHLAGEWTPEAVRATNVARSWVAWRAARGMDEDVVA